MSKMGVAVMSRWERKAGEDDIAYLHRMSAMSVEDPTGPTTGGPSGLDDDDDDDYAYYYSSENSSSTHDRDRDGDDGAHPDSPPLNKMKTE